MYKYKLKYLCTNVSRKLNGLIGKDPDAGKDWRQEEKEMTEGEMVGWPHRLDGHEFEQAPGVGDGLGSLASWRVRHEWMTELTEKLLKMHVY